MKIKDLEKSLARLLPPFLFEALITFLVKIRFVFASKDMLKPNPSSFKKLKKSKRAFLLATGPSIKNQDLSQLKGEDCFSLSNFFLHEDVASIEPRLHFFAPYHEPLDLDNYVDWLRKSDTELPKKTNIVLGYKERLLVEKYGLFPNRQVSYLYLDRVKAKSSLSLSKPLPIPKTGPQMILPVLIAMGYEEICLVGCDHTVLRDFGKTITNFYKPEKDMRKNATSDLAWPSIVTQLIGNGQLFQLYYDYKNLVDDKYPKTRIINLSPDSWLDCFEFGDFDSILKSKS